MHTTRDRLLHTAWVSAGFCALLLACGAAAIAAPPQLQAKPDTAVADAAQNAVPAAGTIQQHSVQNVANALQGRLDHMLPQGGATHGR